MSQTGIVNIKYNGGPNRFPITPFVVGPSGQAGYQTIQSGLNAANSAGGGIVYVQPGTYTENLSLFGNTQVVGVPGNSDSGTSGNDVIINGIHTPPTTGSFVFANVLLQSATHIFSSVSAGTASLILENLLTNITSGYIFNLPNWTGSLITYNIGEGSTNNGVVNNSGGSTCFFISATHGAGTANAMITSGIVILQEIDLNCSWTAQTGTSLACDYTIFTQNITLSNNSSGAFNGCRFSTGSNPALTMSSSGAIQIANSLINSTNNPAITGSGSGALSLSAVTFSNNSNLASTLNATYLSNNSVNSISNYVTVASGVTYTTGASDYYISCDPTSSAITIKLPNAPSTNRIYIIKDRTGHAGSHNISVTTVGGTVTIDGSTTNTISSNFGSISVVFNGTSYEVFT